jgi:ATP-dependent DNA ligase
MIAEALKALRVKSVTIDGEGVMCDRDGVTDFNLMRAAVGREGLAQSLPIRVRPTGVGWCRPRP